MITEADTKLQACARYVLVPAYMLENNLSCPESTMSHYVSALRNSVLRTHLRILSLQATISIAAFGGLEWNGEIMKHSLQVTNLSF